ncbi:predicted protein [Naegleria gruberi]|uniref:Predicted protein n=1 Tax=Naegleria gruberi TaxID=5762 RepID=D2VVB4_NAEGR|nr:uncharacterized protein NAEGRDRAFT_72956 [Naegleria gruberi]EFC39206.1 predicted protein [Naegleria gruberi]|eukprot:XP_002671950.1 predicted protein [Naegleria gruberi strain NEG-M]
MFGFTSESRSNSNEDGGFVSPAKIRSQQQSASVSSSHSNTMIQNLPTTSNTHALDGGDIQDMMHSPRFEEDEVDYRGKARDSNNDDEINQYEISIPVSAIVLNTSFTPILVTNQSNSTNLLSNNQQFMNVSGLSNNSSNQSASGSGQLNLFESSTSQKPRPQSARYCNSSISSIVLAMNPPTPPQGEIQQNKLLAVSNIENSFNNSGNSLLSSQNSACSGAHTTSSIISNKGSGTGSNGESGWTMTKQQRERFQHVEKLRSKLFESMETMNWLNEKASSSKHADQKNSVEVKKQKFVMECVSKLKFLDEFYDALNGRVRTFDCVRDVVEALDNFCSNILSFSHEKFGYIRSQESNGSSSSRKSIRMTTSTGLSTVSVGEKKSGSGNLLTGALSRDPSSEDMGSGSPLTTTALLKSSLDNNINELANAMEQNKLSPCFQHERLRDFIIGIWLELTKCDNNENKLNTLLNTKIKRSVVDSERINNTFNNSRRNSTNLTSLLQSTEDSSLSLFNSSLVRKESVKTLEKILIIEENLGEKLSNDIRILTDMFLTEMDDILAVFHDKQVKFIRSWYNEALDKCLLPFHSLNAMKKRKECLKGLKTDHTLSEEDFALKYVIEKDWKFLDRLCEYTPDWKIVSKNLPLVSAWTSNENYSNISDMRLTKFVGYFDCSIENATRALSHDVSLEKIYNNRVVWHEYSKPSMSSSLEKFPTALMSCVNETSGLHKKQSMELVISGKTKFIGNESTTELVESCFCFKSCNILKGNNSKDSDSSRFISIGARYITKVDNNRIRVMEVRFSRIAGFLKKTFLFSINMKKEMGLFYTSLIEIFTGEEEKGFPLASTSNNLMKVICDYARTYCHVDFGMKYSHSEDEIPVI